MSANSRDVLALDDGGHQFVLVREPPVDGGAADPGPAGDVVEGDPPKAVPFELDDGGVEDGCPVVGSAPGIAR